MVNSINSNNFKLFNSISFKNNSNQVIAQPLPSKITTQNSILPYTSAPSKISTFLSADDVQKYLYLLNFMRDYPVSPNSEGMSPSKQLEYLLRNGKLLSRSMHDNSTTLDNIYSIAVEPRACNLNQKQLVSNVLDILVNPRVVSQTFGDIPESEKQKILEHLKTDDPAKVDPSLMNVVASGTCPAASNEVNMADNYPAEFARWVSKLSSPEKALYLDIDLSSISKNFLEATTILDLLEAQKKDFNFNKVRIKVNADDNAYIRAAIQDKHWDKGERNVADVLVQSAIMQLGSQNTYNSLIDSRGGKFSTSPQGLIEIEKTFVESLIKNKEITSFVYQKIDDDQNLLGYNCSFDKMKKHIKDTIDSGEDVIIGYVLTNETSGRTSMKLYNPSVDGLPNKIINGHEITIVDYKYDNNGKMIFVCVDTDDNNNDFVEYSEDWLLPKLHHAGYPAHIVEADEEEIMRNAMS